jgi:hypothetical protein
MPDVFHTIFGLAGAMRVIPDVSPFFLISFARPLDNRFIIARLPGVGRHRSCVLHACASDRIHGTKEELDGFGEEKDVMFIPVSSKGRRLRRCMYGCMKHFLSFVTLGAIVPVNLKGPAWSTIVKLAITFTVFDVR